MEKTALSLLLKLWASQWGRELPALPEIEEGGEVSCPPPCELKSHSPRLAAPRPSRDLPSFAEDPVIQSFLEADIFLKVSDKVLTALTWGGTAGSPPHEGRDRGQGVSLGRSPGETHPWCQQGRQDKHSALHRHWASPPWPPVVASSPRVKGPGDPQQGPPWEALPSEWGWGTWPIQGALPAIQPWPPPALPLSVSMQYLLSMVVEYFGRVGLPGHLYNRIHFFLALWALPEGPQWWFKAFKGSQGQRRGRQPLRSWGKECSQETLRAAGRLTDPRWNAPGEWRQAGSCPGPDRLSAKCCLHSGAPANGAPLDPRPGYSLLDSGSCRVTSAASPLPPLPWGWGSSQGQVQPALFPGGSYIASDMEEDNPMSKRSIFQFLLGREHWPDLYKEFLKLKVEFFHAMGHRAWVTPEVCEEVCLGWGLGATPQRWGVGTGPFLGGLTLLCFPFRSRLRTHITGSGVGRASAPPRFPRKWSGECSWSKWVPGFPVGTTPPHYALAVTSRAGGHREEVPLRPWMHD